MMASGLRCNVMLRLHCADRGGLGLLHEAVLENRLPHRNSPAEELLNGVDVLHRRRVGPFDWRVSTQWPLF